MKKREPSIRLHEKHGVNPTLCICFWCGADRGDIALLGAGYRGQAPMRMIVDYEPCEKCKAGMATGVAIIEAKDVTPDERDHRQLTPGAVPTGRWFVVTDDSIRRMFTPPATADAAIKARKALMDVATFSRLVSEYESLKKETDQ